MTYVSIMNMSTPALQQSPGRPKYGVDREGSSKATTASGGRYDIVPTTYLYVNAQIHAGLTYIP
jgi:hypothetical protein